MVESLNKFLDNLKLSLKKFVGRIFFLGFFEEILDETSEVTAVVILSRFPDFQKRLFWKDFFVNP